MRISDWSSDVCSSDLADVFATDDTEDRCLVVIDIRRYSRQSYLIAEQASEHGIPLIVLTDLFCDWAPRFTPHVIAVPTQTGMFWSSPVALVCAVNLMVNRSEEHTSELQSIMRNSYAGFCLKKKKLSLLTNSN